MAEQRSIIVEPLVVQVKDKGARNDENLKSAFYASPIYNELSDEERIKTFLNLTRGIIENGNGINSFDTRFRGNDQNPVPNLENVETGGGGLPSTSFTPNLTSPGVGSVNAAGQPEYEGEFKSPENISNHGSGLGGALSPHEISENISKGSESLRNYILGRSYKGSDGKV
jgi:hypothetical protein